MEEDIFLKHSIIEQSYENNVLEFMPTSSETLVNNMENNVLEFMPTDTDTLVNNMEIGSELGTRIIRE